MSNPVRITVWGERGGNLTPGFQPLQGANHRVMGCAADRLNIGITDDFLIAAFGNKPLQTVQHNHVAIGHSACDPAWCLHSRLSIMKHSVY
jgi:hypothetical protein